MIKRNARIAALIMAVLMLSSAAACGKKDTSSDSSDDVEIEYVYQSGDSSGSASGTGDSASGDKANNSSSGSKKNNSKTVNDGINPEDYRGTTVRYATWRDPKLYEDGPVVEAFQKKYGIKVQVDLIPQTEYLQTLTSRIASGDASDVVFCTDKFPEIISVMQPIDAAKLNLNESIWDQGTINLTAVNGKKYLVNTVGNIWNEVDCLYFNKKLLEENNITTPAEYYKAGKWTFDAMTKVMQEVSALGSQYVGGCINLEGLLGSTGSAFYKFENGQFKNGTDSKFNDVMRFVSTNVKNGLIKGLTVTEVATNFPTGKYGIAITHAFGLKSTGAFRKMNPSDIGFTYLPAWDANSKVQTTSLVRGWGLCTGAKNPVAAGIFMRYYTDVDNYNTSSAFLNSEAESFFFKLTAADTTNRTYYFLTSISSLTGSTALDYFYIPKEDPNQVATKIASLQNSINANVAKANEFLSNKK